MAEKVLFQALRKRGYPRQILRQVRKDYQKKKMDKSKGEQKRRILPPIMTHS